MVFPGRVSLPSPITSPGNLLLDCSLTPAPKMRDTYGKHFLTQISYLSFHTVLASLQSVCACMYRNVFKWVYACKSCECLCVCECKLEGKCM